MRNFRYSLLFISIVFLAGCGISRQTAELQGKAETAYHDKDYREALSHYEELIELKKERGQEVSGKTYFDAGMAAWHSDESPKAVEYLREAHRNGVASEQSYYILAIGYREIDNLSLELTNLEAYAENYPKGEKSDYIHARLFEVYIEISRYEEALGLWPLIEEDAGRDAGLLEGYFELNRQLDREEELEPIARRLLALDANNKIALEYLAEHYFWTAENRYQDEMKAYERNRTRRQYRQLLDALDEINEQFKISRDYFERLYNAEPNGHYASYLKNIYIRFGNEERAEYYRRRENR